MAHARKLPAYLVARYRGWRATGYAENKSWFRHLVQEGQHPRTMMIGCCDSRVHMTEIFEADPGEFFIHRNIANLVPPFAPTGDHHCSFATRKRGSCQPRLLPAMNPAPPNDGIPR